MRDIMKPIKTLLVGCGGIAQHHANFLPKLEGVEIVACADLIPEKAQKMSEKLCCPWTTDYHEYLEACDSVFVCVEPFNRKEIVFTAANAKKHVFTEKPISVSIKEAREMQDVCRKNGVIYMVGYCLRYWFPYTEIKKAVDAGLLGDIVSVWMRRINNSDMSELWYGWQEKSGGVMLDFGSHDVNMLRWLGGDIDEVWGSVYKMRETNHCDEHAAMFAKFKNGGMGHVESSWMSMVGEGSVGVIGTKGAAICGRDGKLRMRTGDGEETVFDEQGAMEVNTSGEAGTKDEKGNLILAEKKHREDIQEHFFRCIREGITPVSPSEDAIETLRTVMAFELSVKLGQPVKVDSLPDIEVPYTY